MPLYAYRCGHCDSAFEARSSIGARDEMSCPTCARPVERLMSTVAVVRNSHPEPAGCGSGRCEARREAGLPCAMDGA